MSFLGFLRANLRWLGAGAILTASSGFGQTYFISLYAGVIRGEFGLSHGQWGGIYTIGTLASAALMLWVGPLVDRITIRRMAGIILGVFALVCLAMAVNRSVLLLIVIIFGLRFCGQGMLSHVPLVGVGRWFAAGRGRAVSIVSLGYPMAEAVFPFIFVSLMLAFGWRETWVIAAGCVLLVIPVIRHLLAAERAPGQQAETADMPGMGGRHWTRRDAMGHWLFWMVFPVFLMMPVFSTSLFFQQVHLTEVKGWPLAGFVALFPILSLTSVAAMLVTGPMLDRIGSGRVVPFFLIPVMVAFLILSQGTGLGAAALGLFFLGLSGGVSNALGGAFWPEYYGTRHLGAIRSVATSAMVFGSAIGPGITGALIDAGISFDRQMIGIVILMALASGLALIAMRRARSLISVA